MILFPLWKTGHWVLCVGLFWFVILHEYCNTVWTALYNSLAVELLNKLSGKHFIFEAKKMSWNGILHICRLCISQVLKPKERVMHFIFSKNLHGYGDGSHVALFRFYIPIINLAWVQPFNIPRSTVQKFLFCLFGLLVGVFHIMVST